MRPDEFFQQEAMQEDQAMHGLYETWLRDEAAQAEYCQWLASLETQLTQELT